MLNILTFVISYLIAALSPAIIISKRVLKKDIRELGSKNAGTTNAIRTMGKGIGAIVFVLDTLKVALSYIILLAIFALLKEEMSPVTKTLYMLASVIGHSYPVYYGFKGGKGVAVIIMSAIIVDYKLALACVVVGVILIAIFRMVSLGSLVGVILLAVLSIFWGANFNFWILLITVLVVIYNHRENIQRIIAGKENKLF